MDKNTSVTSIGGVVFVCRRHHSPSMLYIDVLQRSSEEDHYVSPAASVTVGMTVPQLLELIEWLQSCDSPRASPA